MFEASGIIIRTTRLTDSSLIVHWFTAEQGLVKTVAKGALRPKSGFAGKLDLFFGGEIQAVMQKKGDLALLREVTIHKWRQGLRRNYLTTLMAGYFCQLLEAVVEIGQEDVELYDLLDRALDYLEVQEPNMKAMRHFEKQLSQLLGISGGMSSPAEEIRNHCGALPASRKSLVDRLSHPLS